MNGVIWKLFLIAVVVALCVWSVVPVDQKIRLGKDLRGGVSLVYAVNIPADADRDQVLAQVIDVLKQRVNPQGILDIAFQPQGLDRIEIVMPLPSPDVRVRQKVFQKSLEELVSKSVISDSQLDGALNVGNAAELFGGDDPDRVAQFATLQSLHEDAKQAREQLQQVMSNPDIQPGAIDALQDRIARAELRSDELKASLLAARLPEARVQSVLRLPNDSRSTVIDGELIRTPSRREQQIELLRNEFPHLSGSLESLLKTYGAYEEVRTGLDDPEDLKRMLKGAGVLEYQIAVSTTNPQGVNPADMRAQLQDRGARNTDSSVARWFPINDIKQWADSPEQLVALEANPSAYFGRTRASGGRDLVADKRDGQIYLLLYTTPEKTMSHDAGEEWTMLRTFRQPDQLGRDSVGFKLDANGGRLMSKLTGPNIQQAMAIVLDDQVYSAPTLQSRISDSGTITGSFSNEELSYLIRVLAAGALEARLSAEPISTSVLGPTIGAENLFKGLEAVLLAVIVVAILMLCYYFFAGLVADIALCLNAIMIFGIMAMIDGTFTLPGLAGIALTVGMAVDASVLVYERIREELVNNKEDLRIAVRLGYKKAASAIFDGNITNLIVCFVLYQTAATEVKGFALTLSLGVLGTLFTTLFVGRLIFDIVIEGFGARKFPGMMLPVLIPAIHRILQPSIDWIRWRYVFQGFSLAIAVVGLLLFFGRGNDMLETEFRGGVSLTMSTRAAVEGEPATADGSLAMQLDDVRARLKEMADAAPAGSPIKELGNATVLTSGETNSATGASAFQVKVANPPDATDDDAIESAIVAAVVEAFADQLNITKPVNFSGEGDDQHASRTFSLEKATVGENIGRAGNQQQVGDFRGGVLVLVENVTPPITVEDLDERIQRMRTQPDFSDALGRRCEVVGLSSSNSEGTFSDFAIMVTDEELNSFEVDLETWDAQLAKREWELASAALTREASLEQVSSFSPTVAQQLVASAVVAVILSLLGMLVYIWVRFGNLWYSLAAVSALCFNISVCLGALAISVMVGSTGWASGLYIEEFRIDLNVIAGLLTIIGYSLNDTIVILDRIRENKGRLPYASQACVNLSINQTFSRTVLTSGTTIVTALILLILGGTGIRPFAFTFLIGLVAATFSSVAIAAPMVFRKSDQGGGYAADDLEEDPKDPASLPA
jgi:SecD/SecF fusion protein